jgi:hypothetical protein
MKTYEHLFNRSRFLEEEVSYLKKPLNLTVHSLDKFAMKFGYYKGELTMNGYRISEEDAENLVNWLKDMLKEQTVEEFDRDYSLYKKGE